MSIRTFAGWGSIAMALFVVGCDKKSEKAEEKSEKATKDDGEKKTKKGDDSEKYAAGDAVKYLPKACKGGRFYFNLGTFLKNEAVEKAAEALEDKISEGIKKKDKAGKKLAPALKALKKAGIDPARDIKEVALCFEPGMKQGAMTIGGNFAGKDPIKAIAKAAEEADEKDLEQKESDGISYVKDGKKYVAAIAPNVLLFTDSKAQFADLKGGDGGGSGWDLGKGRILSFDMDDKKNGKFIGSITEEGEDLTFKVTADFAGDTGDKIEEDPQTFKKQFEKMRDSLESKLKKGPFKKIADDIGNAKIKVDGSKVTVTLTMPSADLGDSIKKAAEMKDDELENAVDL